MKNFLKNIVLLFVSTVLCLIVLELVSRKCFTLIGENWHDASDWDKEMWYETHEYKKGEITNVPIDRYDSLYGWTLKENLRNAPGGTEPAWTVNSNSNGVRGTKEYSFEKTGKLRIVTIGDSFTFGECVNDSETYSAVLESLLDNAEVINLSIHGYGNDQQLLKLLQQGVKYHPDIVLLGFLNDDINRNKISFRDYAKPYYVLENDSLCLQGVPVPSPDYLNSGIRLKSLGLLKAKWSQLNENRNNASNELLTKKILAKMVSVTEGINAKMVVVYLPWISECKNGKAEPIGAYTSLTADPAVVAIDPTDEIHTFLSTQKNPDAHFACHYSAAVNKIVGHVAAERVRKLKN